MKPMLDRTGVRYGNLVALLNLGTDKFRQYLWLCRCDCGNNKVVQGSNLSRTTSCGCIGAATRGKSSITHGMSSKPEYKIYMGILKRCANPRSRAYRYYGARGIKVLFSSFEEFYKEMGPRPTKRHSVERINNDGHYEPGNVKWATHKEQMNNRVRNGQNWPNYGKAVGA